MDDVSIRSYRDGDEDGILELFHRRFHPRRTRDHWRWKFRDHPLGRALISVATGCGGEIIAHCAGYPVELVDARPAAERRSESVAIARSLRCLQIGDVMASSRMESGPGSRGDAPPDHGLGGGVFEATFRHFRRRLRSAGIPFMYGVVAASSDRFYARKMERGLVGPVAYRRCVAAELTERVSSPRSHVSHRPVARIRSVADVRRAAADFDDLFGRAAPSYGVLSRRDAAYIAWRYCRCPDQVHRLYVQRSGRRLIGWAAFRRIESRLVWGDALIDPEHPEAAVPLLDAALRDHDLEELDAVEAWFPAHPEWWERRLVELGFRTLVEPRGLRLVYVCADGAPRDENNLAGGLYYSMGDTDLF